jgi:hypothetical protein
MPSNFTTSRRAVHGSAATEVAGDEGLSTRQDAGS